MSIPVAPLPEKELCAYERLRENNIKEREAAMAECEYFDSLKCMEEEMGMAAHYNNKSQATRNVLSQTHTRKMN